MTHPTPPFARRLLACLLSAAFLVTASAAYAQGPSSDGYTKEATNKKKAKKVAKKTTARKKAAKKTAKTTLGKSTKVAAKAVPAKVAYKDPWTLDMPVRKEALPAKQVAAVDPCAKPGTPGCAPQRPKVIPPGGTRPSPLTDDSASAVSGKLAKTINSIRFERNTLVASDELAAAAASGSVGNELSEAEARRITAMVSQAYLRYNLVAHASITPESLATGDLVVVITEAKVGAINVKGDSATRISADAAKDFLTAQQPEGAPLRMSQLDKGIRILNELPGVAATSTLAPGSAAGTTNVTVQIKDKPLVEGKVAGDNYGSKATGQGRLIASGALNNPSGRGDQATALAMTTGQTIYGRAGYELPVGTSGLRAGISAGAMSYKTDKALAGLDNSGSSSSFGVNASYPLLRDANTSITATVAAEGRALLDESLNVRAIDRKTKTTTAGVAVQHTGGLGQTTANATLTFGKLDLGNNIADIASDAAGPQAAGSFSKFNWSVMQQYPLNNQTELIGSASGQTASKNLDSGEKFSLGGPNGVRGYQNFEGSGDSGWVGSVELRRSLLPELQVGAFVDFGHTTLNKSTWAGWNAADPTVDNSYMLYGTGLGVTWKAPYDLDVSAAVAVPLGKNPGRTAASADDGSLLDRTNAWVNIQKQF